MTDNADMYTRTRPTPAERRRLRAMYRNDLGKFKVIASTGEVQYADSRKQAGQIIGELKKLPQYKSVKFRIEEII